MPRQWIHTQTVNGYAQRWKLRIVWRSNIGSRSNYSWRRGAKKTGFIIRGNHRVVGLTLTASDVGGLMGHARTRKWRTIVIEAQTILHRAPSLPRLNDHKGHESVRYIIWNNEGRCIRMARCGSDAVTGAASLVMRAIWQNIFDSLPPLQQQT